MSHSSGPCLTFYLTVMRGFLGCKCPMWWGENAPLQLPVNPYISPGALFCWRKVAPLQAMSRLKN